MRITNVRFIRLSPHEVVLKRGVAEILLEGRDISATVEQLLQLSGSANNVADLVSNFPGSIRTELKAVVESLIRRGFIQLSEDSSVSPLPVDTDDFYSNFGQNASDVVQRLRSASVLLVGQNRITSTMARSLNELGVGSVTVVAHPILGYETSEYEKAFVDPRASKGIIRFSPDFPRDSEVADYSLICAASEIGEADALLDINRIGLKLSRPFMPIWFDDLLGFLGPLNYPFESPCFSCFRLRRDAGEPRFKIARQIRHFITSEPSERSHFSLLGPMPKILGEIATIEVVKAAGQFILPDTIGHVIEMNLISFRSSVRRVLKIPRCPECSSVCLKSSKAITRGPHIPLAEVSK